VRGFEPVVKARNFHWEDAAGETAGDAAHELPLPGEDWSPQYGQRPSKHLRRPRMVASSYIEHHFGLSKRAPAIYGRDDSLRTEEAVETPAAAEHLYRVHHSRSLRGYTVERLNAQGKTLGVIKDPSNGLPIVLTYDEVQHKTPPRRIDAHLALPWRYENRYHVASTTGALSPTVVSVDITGKVRVDYGTLF
jgi:hypothetical protein